MWEPMFKGTTSMWSGNGPGVRLFIVPAGSEMDGHRKCHEDGLRLRGHIQVDDPRGNKLASYFRLLITCNLSVGSMNQGTIMLNKFEHHQ